MADPNDVLKQYSDDDWERGMLLPIARNKATNEMSPAVPGVLHEPYKAIERFMNSRYTADQPPVAESLGAAASVMGPAMGLNMMGFGAPKNAVGIFGGPLGAKRLAAQGKPEQMQMLTRAQELAANGEPRQRIWNDTGWFQGADGHWRFEIPDNLAHWPRDLQHPFKMTGMAEGNTYLNHPELAATYPTVADAPMHVRAGPNFRHIEGEFYPPPGANPHAMSYSQTNVRAPNLEGAKEAALHERQHAVATIEGFHPGGSPEDFLHNPAFPKTALAQKAAQERGFNWETLPESLKARFEEDAAFQEYKRLAGEVEARNVQTRMNMTPEERRMIPPWMTQDTDDVRQILGQYGEPGAQMSRAAPKIPELPMDDAARLARARQMGFDADRVWYHGTEKAGFPAFDESLANSNSNTGATGVYFTENRRNAATYAGPDREAKIIKDAAEPFDPRYDGEPGIYSTYIRPGRQKVEDWGGMNWDEGPLGYNVNRAAKRAREEGYDSFRATNITDEGRHGHGYHWGNETLVVFDPANIRSTGAVFDPSKAGSADLLASASPFDPITTATILQQYQNRERKD